jgi:hypothetical protein
MATLIREQLLVTETCCNCGVLFAWPQELQQKALEERGPRGRSFYCPNGHAQHFTGKTEEEKLREQLEAKQRSLEWSWRENERVRDQRDCAERSAAAYKGHVTRLRNRISNGVCPVADCKRSFINVRRHIATMHKDWAHEHPDVMHPDVME